jgi:DNA-binding NtrC family response regulator
MNRTARILVIDDDEEILTTFSIALRGEGYTVDTAKTGKEAVEKSKTNLYSLALIDIRLPDMDGTELLTKMKETTPKMRKIVVTGYPSMNGALRALIENADGYIVKPAKPDDIIEKVREQLKKQEEEKIRPRENGKVH